MPDTEGCEELADRQRNVLPGGASIPAPPMPEDQTHAVSKPGRLSHLAWRNVLADSSGRRSEIHLTTSHDGKKTDCVFRRKAGGLSSVALRRCAECDGIVHARV